MLKTWEIIENLARGYLSESTQEELSNECQHDRARMVFVLVLHVWMKVASTLKGLTSSCRGISFPTY